MDRSVERVLSDPCLHLAGIDRAEATAKFVEPSDCIYSTGFVDARVDGVEHTSFAVDLEHLIQGFRSRARVPRIGLMPFVAYSCSTFLLRCLHELGGIRTVGEPRAIGDVTAQWSSDTANYRDVLHTAAYCLSTRNDRNTVTVIKTIDEWSTVIPELLRGAGSPPLLFLYSNLEQYLLSSLRMGKDSDRRRVERRAAVVAAHNYMRHLGGDAIDVDKLEDAAAFALNWCVMQLWYRSFVADQLVDPHCACLNCEHLLQRPIVAIREVARHFGIIIDEKLIGSVLHGSCFTSYLKAEQQEGRYDVSDRAKVLRQARRSYGAEAERGIRWAGDIFGGLTSEQIESDLLSQWLDDE